MTGGLAGCENVIDSLKSTKSASELSKCDHLGFRHRKQTESVSQPGDLERWFGFLKHSADSCDSEVLEISAHLRQLVKEGIPTALRPVVYPRIAQVTKTSIADYQKLGNSIAHPDRTVEKDLLRTLPNNLFFMRLNDEGTQRLRRVLNRLKDRMVEYGYCQGMGLLAAHLLLIMEEAPVFYVCLHLLKRLPPRYFSPDLAGLRAEQAVLRVLVKQKLPRLDSFLSERSVDLSFFSVQWLVTLFAGVLPGGALFQLWDRLLVEGISVVHSVALSLLRYFEHELISIPEASDVFHFLAELPGRIQSGVEVSNLSDLAPLVSVTDETLSLIRKRELANLEKEKQREEEAKQIKLRAEDLTPIEQNYVNLSPHLKQAEVVYSVRHAVDAICRHFGLDINVLLDYDHDEDYNSTPISTLYGVATVDQEPEEKGDLELTEGDVVQITDDTGEYWHGANQRTRLVGRFSAQAVRPLRARLGYDENGDVHRDQNLSRLVFDLLLSAFKFVLTHGLREKFANKHPFQLLVALAQEHKNRRIKNINHSINRSFNLAVETGRTDEDTLDEWLTIVQLLNRSNYATFDEKLFTFILTALNRGQMHEYWRSISTQGKLVDKWFTNQSFVNSPGKNQITCLLIPLSRLPFYYQETGRSVTCMNNSLYQIDRTLSANIEELIVKHHLFSWEL